MAHGGRSDYNHLRCLALSNGIGRSRVDQVLEQVGLEHVARRRLGGFFLGMGRPDSAGALRGTGETLLWRAADALSLGERGEWSIERGPAWVRWQTLSGEAGATINGPAKSLLLILTRRRRLTDEADQVSVNGDLDLVRHWIEHTAHVSD